MASFSNFWYNFSINFLGAKTLPHEHLERIPLSLLSKQDRKSIIMLNRNNNLGLLEIRVEKIKDRWLEEYYITWQALPKLLEFCDTPQKRKKYVELILPLFYVEKDNNGS